jgi:hypothetical protein
MRLLNIYNDDKPLTPPPSRQSRYSSWLESSSRAFALRSMIPVFLLLATTPQDLSDKVYTERSVQRHKDSHDSRVRIYDDEGKNGRMTRLRYVCCS